MLDYIKTAYSWCNNHENPLLKLLPFLGVGASVLVFSALIVTFIMWHIPLSGIRLVILCVVLAMLPVLAYHYKDKHFNKTKELNNDN